MYVLWMMAVREKRLNWSTLNKNCFEFF